MKRKIFWSVFIIVVGTITWVSKPWYDRERNSVNTNLAENFPKAKDLEQKVLSFTIDGRSPKGVKQWHLEGNSAEIKGEDIHLNDLKAIAYGESTVVNLASDKGVYSKDRGEVELISNVEVVTDDGLTLSTEWARWSQETKEISTDSVVHIKRKGMSAVGKGGMANSDEKKAMLKEKVMVIMEPDTKVNCDGSLEVDYNNNVAVFYDNVMVEDKDGRLFSDKLTVNFESDTQKISEVVAEGNVKIKKGNSYTISEKAIYTDSTKSAKLLGKPRVVIDPAQLDELEGFSGIGNRTESEEIHAPVGN